MQNQQKKPNQRYSLRYCRRLHDRRVYGTNIYKPHFLDIIACKCKKDLEDAKKRIFKARNGSYYYVPSKEYVHMVKKFHFQSNYSTLHKNHL